MTTQNDPRILYSSGYPNRFRSDVFHWLYLGGRPHNPRIALTDFRREVRRAYHTIKAAQRAAE